MKKMIRPLAISLTAGLLMTALMPAAKNVMAADDTIILTICNWEEYIDEGGWDEVIDLESGDIESENGIISDFEDWYYETYGKKVEVQYSCAGTNEELYSQLCLGDTFDLICPSDYLIMKLMADGMLEPLDDSFFDETDEYNYYVKGVAPFIQETFANNEINGETWEKYSACYMWGITGFVYNPEYVDEEDVLSWDAMLNEKYYRQITIKDNVRDSYFPALGIFYKDKLLSEDFINSEDYDDARRILMNDTDPATVDEVEEILKAARINSYSFETDSGKADMVTGKVVISLQWSGDGVYAMDQAEEDETYLYWAVPEEVTNLWFDGWVMLKSGINGDTEKKHAAQAFINFVSRPDNAVRNMYYIGYTSAITGGEDDTVFEYVDWCYGADEDAEEVAEYPLGFYFSGDNSDEDYVITADADQLKRQLYAQYPTEEIIDRSAIMWYFDDEATKNTNQMWINVRCFNFSQLAPSFWVKAGVALILVAAVILLVVFRRKIFIKSKKIK